MNKIIRIISWVYIIWFLPLFLDTVFHFGLFGLMDKVLGGIVRIIIYYPILVLGVGYTSGITDVVAILLTLVFFWVLFIELSKISDRYNAIVSVVLIATFVVLKFVNQFYYTDIFIANDRLYTKGVFSDTMLVGIVVLEAILFYMFRPKRLNTN